MFGLLDLILFALAVCFSPIELSVLLLALHLLMLDPINEFWIEVLLAVQSLFRDEVELRLGSCLLAKELYLASLLLDLRGFGCRFHPFKNFL